MNARTIALVVAVATLAVLLWWTNSPTRAVVEPPAAAPADLPPPAAAPANVAAPLRVEAVAPAQGLRVRVVGEGDAPQAGANVRCSGDDMLRFAPTDADGVTIGDRFPAADVALAVEHAGARGGWSWRWGAPIGEPITIRLRRDRDVEVTVRDEGGQPIAGVTVQLSGPDRQPLPEPRDRTDQDGRVRLQLRGDQWLAMQGEVTALAFVDGQRFEAGPAPWAVAGATSLSVVVKPDGTADRARLIVRFVDAAGAPAHLIGMLHWSRITRGGAVVWPAGEQSVDGTSARIGGLPEQDHLEVELREPSRLVVTGEVRMPAGAMSHEISLQRGAGMPRLEIPLVSADGGPVTGGDFQLYASFADSSQNFGRPVRPDARGVLEMVLPLTDAGTLEVARVRRADQLHWPETAGVKRPYNTTFGLPPPPHPPLAVLPFPACAPDTTHRLPAVVVPDLLPRITGRVVDSAGRPVPGVRIGITSVQAPEPLAFANFATRTDDSGAFAVNATAVPAEVFVFGRRRLGFCAPVRASSGTPVELTLQPTGAIAMDVRLPAGQTGEERSRSFPSISTVVDEAVLQDGWWALFRDRVGAGRADLLRRWHKMVSVRTGGEVTLDDLVPGTYEVRGHVGVNEVVRVPGVRIGPGETVRPPQIDGVPFGASVERTWVRVRGPDGAPLQGARVRFKISEWRETYPGGTNEQTDAKGEAWFMVPRNTVTDVEVVANGLAPHRESSARFPLEVTMGRGTALDVTIHGHAMLKDEVRFLAVSCRAYDGLPPDTPAMDLGGILQLHHPQANVGDDGRCSIPSLQPGRWRVWLAAHPPLNDTARGFTFVLLGDYTLTAGSPPRIAIERRLDAADLATLRGR